MRCPGSAEASAPEGPAKPSSKLTAAESARDPCSLRRHRARQEATRSVRASDGTRRRCRPSPSSATRTPARRPVQRADQGGTPKSPTRCSSRSIRSSVKLRLPDSRSCSCRHRRIHRSSAACAGGRVRATLEETADRGLVLHVIDASERRSRSPDDSGQSGADRGRRRRRAAARGLQQMRRAHRR